MISGQVTKGYKACTVCGPNVTSEYSSSLKCIKFRGHRRFLGSAHPYRRSRYFAAHFNKKQELRGPPAAVTKEQILAWGAEKATYDNSKGLQDGEGDPAKKYGVKRQTLMDTELDYWR